MERMTRCLYTRESAPRSPERSHKLSAVSELQEPHETETLELLCEYAHSRCRWHPARLSGNGRLATPARGSHRDVHRVRGGAVVRERFPARRERLRRPGHRLSAIPQVSGRSAL